MRVLTAAISVTDVDQFVADIDQIHRDIGPVIQAFDARYIACARQLERAVELARRAYEQDTAVADSPAIEILLYAAGRRQIDQALTIGVGPSTSIAVFVVDGSITTDETIGRQTELERDVESALCARFDCVKSDVKSNRDEEMIVSYYEISQAERDATDATLCDIVCERVALLDVRK